MCGRQIQSDVVRHRAQRHKSCSVGADSVAECEEVAISLVGVDSVRGEKKLGDIYIRKILNVAISREFKRLLTGTFLAE